MLKIYEILVPTLYGDTNKPISTKHHRNWDAMVRKICGGLTILSVAKGQWIDKNTKELWVERVIPVRIACEPEDLETIIELTISHYRQKAVMFYLISDEVCIRYKQ